MQNKYLRKFQKYPKLQLCLGTNVFVPFKEMMGETATLYFWGLQNTVDMTVWLLKLVMLSPLEEKL